MLLPYFGHKGEKLIRSIKNALKNKLLDNIVTKSVCMAMRLKDKFNIKTKTTLLLLLFFISWIWFPKSYLIKVNRLNKHQHDITYYVECPKENWNENYVGETGRRLRERVIDHNGRDKNSHIFKA